MTDQIPADEVREIIEKMHYHANHDNVRGGEEEYVRFFARQLEDLLPAPPLPTLADMTPVARRACQWMQCEVRGERRIIILVLDDSDENYVVTLDSSGYISHCPLEWVTPLPDLPRMTWPGTEKVENANPVEVGDVIESADDPRLAALPAGSILLDIDGERVTKFDVNPAAWRGPGYVPIAGEGTEYGPWKVLHIGQENDQ